MHICFVSSMHPADDKRVHYKEAVSLVKAGFRVSHIVRDIGEIPDTLDGVRIVRYRTFPGKLGRIRQLTSLYRAAHSVYADAYHCNEVDSWAAGLLLKLRSRAKLIFDGHEIYSSMAAERWAPKPLKPIVTSAMQTAFAAMTAFTDAIVLAKRSATVDYPKASKYKQITVANYADLNVADDGVPCGPAPKDSSAFIVVHLGVFGRIRGWPQLLEALSLTKDPSIRFRIIGAINDGSDDDFARRAEELGVADRIESVGWVPYKQVVRLTAECDAGVIGFQPGVENHIHALPHKLFDYMLAQLPVIAPDFAIEVSEIVRDAECGVLVDVSDPQAIADAYDRLAQDRAIARTLGKNGRRGAIDKYNWQTEEKKLIALYRGIEAAQHPGIAGASETAPSANFPE